ncbi:MAG TPA: hydroxyisourate hydrolase [Candidatus Acidoferrales bacterium]|nr:hydroxyisourate hydrolase [Candidatus Acidoferrales bacterium]
MSPSISTHVLDISLGRPAQGVGVTLEIESADGWRVLGRGATNSDGRAADLLSSAKLVEGKYRLRFDTGAYFSSRELSSFYPSIEITFLVRDAAQHHHVPLLLSPHGYTTYRGS